MKLLFPNLNGYRSYYGDYDMYAHPDVFYCRIRGKVHSNVCHRMDQMLDLMRLHFWIKDYNDAAIFPR